MRDHEPHRGTTEPTDCDRRRLVIRRKLPNQIRFFALRREIHDPLVPAKAATQSWIPACAGISGRLRRAGPLAIMS